jgi:CheY-like chemotaxis protein
MEKAHIFVANDDKDFLELMKELLEGEGYSATVLHVGKNAYEEIKKALPDLLILDIILEQPDAGWKLLDKLTLDPETTNMPVIVCSADVVNIRAKADNLRELGCLVVEKPFDIETMLSTVREALALRR